MLISDPFHAASSRRLARLSLTEVYRQIIHRDDVLDFVYLLVQEHWAGRSKREQKLVADVDVLA